VEYFIYTKELTIDYLCVLFVVDGVKSRHRSVIRQYVGLERNMGEIRRKKMRIYVEFPTDGILIYYKKCNTYDIIMPASLFSRILI
jgi:hypothetical protein